VSLNPAHGEVYLIQYYVICRWLSACRWFSPGTLVSSTNKTDHHDITEILLKVALTTITHQFLLLVFHLLSVKNLDVKCLCTSLLDIFICSINFNKGEAVNWSLTFWLLLRDWTKREWIESKYDNNLFFDIIYPKDIYIYIFMQKKWKWFKASTNRRGRHVISAYHHYSCQFESRSGRGVQHYVIKFVSDLRQVSGFLRVLRFPPPIKLTAMI
jgi:hypothetical protein